MEVAVGSSRRFPAAQVRSEGFPAPVELICHRFLISCEIRYDQRRSVEMTAAAAVALGPLKRDISALIITLTSDWSMALLIKKVHLASINSIYLR